MTEIKLHVEFVTSHPKQRVAALALVDHVQETANCSRVAALRTVAAHLRAKRKAKRQAVAARWLAHRGDIGAFLRREVRRKVGDVLRSNALRVLVGGFAPPRVAVGTVTGPIRQRTQQAVFVSAGWVIVQVAHWYDARCGALAMHRAKRGP